MIAGRAPIAATRVSRQAAAVAPIRSAASSASSSESKANWTR